MNNTIYLADTCALEEESCRKQILNTILNEPNNRLTVLPSVNGELKRHSQNKEDEEEKARGAAALEFLKKNYEQIIHHPLQDGYKGGAVADREIMYFCATHRGQNIHLLTRDKNLATAVAEHCPTTHVQLFKAKGGFQEQATLLGKQYTELCTGHHVYITAAAVNTAVAAGVQHLFPAAAMKYNTASFRTLTPQALEYLLTVSAWEKQTAAHAEVSEKDELTARLLTHPADAKKGVLLLLGEGDEQAPYLALSAKQYQALDNSGFAVWQIQQDGQLTQLAEAPSPKELPISKPTQKPKKPTKTEQKAVTAPSDEPPGTPTQTQPAPPPTPTTAAIRKEMIINMLNAGEITQALKLMTEFPGLVRVAVNYGLEHPEQRDAFSNLLNAMKQKHISIPASCFNFCVNHLLTQSPDVLYRELLKMISLCEPLSACGNAVQQLVKLQKKYPQQSATLGNLRQAAIKNGAPNPKEKEAKEDGDEWETIKSNILNNETKKAMKLMLQSDEWLWHGFFFCLNNLKRTPQFLALINQLSQSKAAQGRKISRQCFESYVRFCKGKSKTQLQSRLEHDLKKGIITKLLEFSEPLGNAPTILAQLSEMESDPESPALPFVHQFRGLIEPSLSLQETT